MLKKSIVFNEIAFLKKLSELDWYLDKMTKVYCEAEKKGEIDKFLEENPEFVEVLKELYSN